MQVFGPLDDAMFASSCERLLELARIDQRSTVRIELDSPGGAFSAGLAMFDTLTLMPCPVAVHCTGSAFGTAAMILAAGTKGRRTAATTARIGLQPLMLDLSSAPATDAAGEARELAKCRSILVDILLNLTGRSLQAVEQCISFGRTFDARQAVDFGLIDRIQNNSDGAAVAGD